MSLLAATDIQGATVAIVMNRKILARRRVQKYDKLDETILSITLENSVVTPGAGIWLKATT